MKEELLKKGQQLLDEVYAAAKEELQPEVDALKSKVSDLEKAAAEFETRLEESYSQGYQQCLADYKATHPGTEEEPELPEAISTTINLENRAAAGFLQCGYTDDIALEGKTKVDDYIKEAVEGDHPSWTEVTNPLIIGEDGDIVMLTLNGITTAHDGNKPIYNLIPQRTYDVQILRDGKVVGSGTVKTTGHLRLLDLDDPKYQVVNARDLGGWKCEGGRVAYGKMIRTAYFPKGITYDTEVARKIRDLGVTLEIDIYNKYNHGAAGWTEANYSFYDYEGMLSNPKNVKSYMTRVLKELEAGGCVLTHCWAGADRTGTLSAVILLMLGVSAANVVMDYELTSMSCWFNRMRINENGLRDFFKALVKYPGDTYQEKIYYWLTVKVGLTADQIKRFKAVMVE